MAHELAHVKNRDSLTMTVTATLAGAISVLATLAMFVGGRNGSNPIARIAVMIFAPMAAGLVQMAISRSREYEADRVGAEICGNPMWLASALAKIERGARAQVNRMAEQNPATAHMYIIHPLAGRRGDRLFSTHPNTENRIAALRQMANELGTRRVSDVTARRAAADLLIETLENKRMLDEALVSVEILQFLARVGSRLCAGYGERGASPARPDRCRHRPLPEPAAARCNTCRSRFVETWRGSGLDARTRRLTRLWARR